ncbi:hypothetical protein BGW80DRAFT_489150 [Lactifluus volemus]|nr:hypothetical protein BGW80DRAFT_489150 [Lactifluus volemus]
MGFLLRILSSVRSCISRAVICVLFGFVPPPAARTHLRSKVVHVGLTSINSLTYAKFQRWRYLLIMSSETTTELSDLVEEWLHVDRNPETKQEISDLWAAGRIEELDKRLRSRIQFGTAGLRGRMEAGWSRMNDLIVIQASQGLCAYVLEHVNDAKIRGVVIGYDHRHHSEKWARLVAAAFLDKGVKTYLYRRLVHTPMVPFGVKRLSAACGVMITASHNPKYDNGYKVYWENGVQVASGFSQFSCHVLFLLSHLVNRLPQAPTSSKKL